MISEEVMISPTETRKLLEDGMSISRIKEMGNMILDVCNTKEVVLVVIFFDVSRRMYRIIGNICEAKGMKKVADDERRLSGLEIREDELKYLSNLFKQKNFYLTADKIGEVLVFEMSKQ